MDLHTPLIKKTHDYVVGGSETLSEEEKRQKRIEARKKAIKEIKERLDNRSNGFDSLDSIPKAKIDYYDEVFNKHLEKEFLHGINRADEMRKDYFENGLTKEEADEKYYNRMHNCYFCTQAAIMRLKGYEVKAQAADRGFPTRLTDPILWENSLVSTERFQDRSEVMKCLADRNDYSYGNISVKWKAGYAHSMIWVKTNDQVIIMDGQLERIRGRYFIKTGEVSSNLEKVFERMDVSKTKLTDLTNAKPTDYMLKMIE